MFYTLRLVPRFPTEKMPEKDLTPLQRQLRAEFFLQRYFDGSLTLGEAEELAQFWELMPGFGDFAVKALETEQGRAVEMRLFRSDILRLLLRPKKSPGILPLISMISFGWPWNRQRLQ